MLPNHSYSYTKDLFQVWPDTSDPSLYAEKIIPIAEETEENPENFKNRMQKDNSLTETNQELKNPSNLGTLNA